MRDASVQTSQFSDKFTQTNNLNLKNSFRHFIRELTDSVYVTDGRPCFPCKKISLLANKYFYLNVDLKWVLQSLQR